VPTAPVNASVMKSPGQTSNARSCFGLFTRYDAEEATLEARAWPWRVEVVIRVAATAQGQGTRLRIESEAASARRLVAAGVNAWTLRRVRAALARAT